ncbi:MAG: helix-turn-helix domain-containing protein [Arcobacteraceae bacterium]|nr:helix-turn-helix domain-containing protein [Arcobacteraceae bacterium]
MNTDILNVLVQKYNRTMLTKQNFADELGVSLSTIDKLIAKGNILPTPVKIGTTKNATIRYAITDIADFITSNTEDIR